MAIILLLKWIIVDRTWCQYDIKVQAKAKELKHANLYNHKYWNFKQYNTWILQQGWSMSSISSVQFSSFAQSCPTLCNPMNRSTPGLPVQHQLPEFTQTHVHWVSDAIQPSHPLSSPSPPALNLPQHQGLSQWVSFFVSGGQSIGISASASVLPVNIQHWFPLGWTGWISLQSKGLSRVFSNTTVKSINSLAQLSLQSSSHFHTRLMEKPKVWLEGPFLAK